MTHLALLLVVAFAAAGLNETSAVVVYDPGRGVVVAIDGLRGRTEIYVQPASRLSLDSNAPAEAETFIRRARFSFAGEMPFALRIRADVQLSGQTLVPGELWAAWAPTSLVDVAFGYLKPPADLDRDQNTFDMPFIERSVTTFLTYDKEVGLRLTGNAADTVRYGVALTRPVPKNGDTEDANPSTESEPPSETFSPGRFDVAVDAAWTPSEHAELGVSGGARFRPAGDPGDRLKEPFGSEIYGARPYRGAGFHVAADAAVAVPHTRAVAEAGYRSDGTATDAGAVGELHAWLGFLVLGFTVDGRYGPAIDGAPLKNGVELVTRLEAAHVEPALGDGLPSTWLGATLGVHWQPAPQLRVQSDVCFESFDAHAEGQNQANAQRIYVQLWATANL